jgi:gamma-glutamylcyclotransferase (GGCT)/AIG2-like uncharacterized protein YtfP
VVVTLAQGAAAEVLDLLDGIEVEGVLYRRVEVQTSCGSALGYEWLGATDGLPLLPDGWPGRTDDATEGTASSAVPS